jgi:hypothetical protein
LIFFKGKVIGDLYPARSDFSLNRLDDAGELPPEMKARSEKSYAEATVDPKLKGFADCDLVDNIDGLPAAINVRGRANANRIDGEPIDDELARYGTSFLFAVERDEYVVFYMRYPLTNIWGGLRWARVSLKFKWTSWRH